MAKFKSPLGVVQGGYGNLVTYCVKDRIGYVRNLSNIMMQIPRNNKRHADAFVLSPGSIPS